MWQREGHIAVAVSLLWSSVTGEEASCPSRAELRAQVQGHTVYPYTSSANDVWTILKAADATLAYPLNVTLIYSNRSVDGAQEYNSGEGWTREHLWPQSLGRFDAYANDAPATDVHAIRAASLHCNSLRNNYRFGVVNATVRLTSSLSGLVVADSCVADCN